MKTYHYRLPEGRNIQSFERSKTTCLVIFKIYNNMDKLVKQLPLVALLLAFTVFVGKAAVQALNTSSTTIWLYNPSLGDPDEETAYTPANGQESNCQGVSTVCAINAPANGNMPNLDADPTLRKALEENEPHDDISFGPFSGTQ